MRASLSLPLSAALAGALCLVLTAACGSSSTGDDQPTADGGNDIEGLQSIDVLPADATLIAEGTTPAVQAYTATGHFADGTTRDITGQVAFVIGDSQLGAFAGAELTTSNRYGGRTTVNARAGSKSGFTNVTIQIRQRASDPEVPDLPADPSGPFGGPADAGRAPTLVYPADGVLVPPNLRRLEIHFLPGTGNQLFAIDFQSATTDVTVYTRCVHPLNGGCIYRPDASVWRWIASSNRGDGDGVHVQVRGTNDAGTGVGTSPQIQVAFSADEIRGGIYYWTTSSTANSDTAIMRFDFASDQTEPELFIGTSMTDGNCVGCHALSRKGDKLVTASEGSYGAKVLLLDVGRRRPMVDYNTTPRSAFSSWSPDGSQFVGVYANSAESGFLSYQLNLFDGTTGAAAGAIGVGGTQAQPIDHPDWSPNGTQIAFTRVGVLASDNGGSLAKNMYETRVEVINNDGSAWGTPAVLTQRTPGVNTYYPAFAPGGDVLAFNKSSCAGGQNGATCDCYDDPNAALWITRPAAGATPIEMQRANAPGVTDHRAFVESSYPKWSPFTFHRVSEEGSRLHWITFSSDRNYGLYTPPATHTLIWMAAVDPDAVAHGSDPSWPAFALPFQDLATDNHTAQWAERVIDDIP